MAHFARISDTFMWPHNNGTFSVKSASKFLFHQQQVPLNKLVWNWICPKKIQLFFWKAMRNRLPTKYFLTIGHNHLDDHCPRCHNPKTTIHILRECPWAKEAWSQSLGILPMSFFHMSLQDWLRCNATAKIIIMLHQLPW